MLLTIFSFYDRIRREVTVGNLASIQEVYIMTASIIEKVWSAIQKNDVADIQDMMDKYHVLEGDVSPCVSKVDKGVVAAALVCASVTSLSGGLEEVMAIELIERMAMKVDIFQLAYHICAAIKAEETAAIPEEIRMALDYEERNDDLIQAINNLDSATFAALLSFIAEGGVKRAHASLFPSIIRRIYKDEIINRGVLFAYMALSLRKAFEEDMAEEYLPTILDMLL